MRPLPCPLNRSSVILQVPGTKCSEHSCVETHLWQCTVIIVAHNTKVETVFVGRLPLKFDHSIKEIKRDIAKSCKNVTRDEAIGFVLCWLLSLSTWISFVRSFDTRNVVVGWLLNAKGDPICALPHLIYAVQKFCKLSKSSLVHEKNGFFCFQCCCQILMQEFRKCLFFGPRVLWITLSLSLFIENNATCKSIDNRAALTLISALVCPREARVL